MKGLSDWVETKAFLFRHWPFWALASLSCSLFHNLTLENHQQRAFTMDNDPVGEFYVHLLKGQEVSADMVSSTHLFRTAEKPTVIHFYDGG